ncbi:MAG TPA: flagellar biosynthetic protein FliR [Steroidobacteraceae bacterium]|nr:flagellar biosynthetic protein FliR [Steroidobacteraceae bacterium]
MLINAVELQEWLLRFIGIFARVGAALMVGPLFGSNLVPRRIRLMVGVAVTVLILSAVPALRSTPATLGPLQLFREVALGAALGFVVQSVFDMLTTAGQAIGLSMGLGFANLIDPQHGTSTPVVGQLYVLLALLVYVALDGHLAFLQLLVDSFRAMPAGGARLDEPAVAALAGWGSRIFSGALQVALPAVVAMTVVNLAFGVISRAAPQLNLFGIGFPLSVILGFVTLWITLQSLTPTFTALFEEAMQLAGDLARGAT